MTGRGTPGRPPAGAMPGPGRLAAVRQLQIMATNRLAMLTRAVARYGEAVTIPVGHKTLYVFNHPDSAKHILADNASNYRKGIGLVHARRALGEGLLTSDGASWRKQRKVIQPAFQPQRIAGHAAAVAEESAALVERIVRRSGGPPIDVVAEMTVFTLGVLGRTLLDADLSVYDTIGHDFAAVQEQAMFELATLNAVPMWIPTPAQLRFRRARRSLARVVDELVQSRPDAAGRDDALSRLIASVADEADPAVGRRRLRDELVTLLLAGHETTASTLSWSLFLLDQHPTVRELVRAEANEVLGDGLPEYADLARLRFTTMVVEEAMRLYPPVWLLPRIAIEADTIGGYRVPAGADVLVSPYILHRHQGFWSDPERFDPSRFDRSRSRARHRYSYLPFGAGPRVCVGMNLAMMEAVFTVAMLTRRVTLSVPAGHPVVAEPMLSLRVRGGLPMTVAAVPAGR